MRGWVSKKLADKPSGVTSLLLVLAIGVVLTVMIGGIAALTVREQQKSSNTELSNRALQTAEAGIDLAVQQLVKNPSYATKECPLDQTASSIYNQQGLNSVNQQITCIEVKSVFKDFEGYLEKDRTSTFFINSENCGAETECANQQASSLKLSWNSPADSTASECSSNCAYPLFTSYNYPASMEISFVYWPIGQPNQMTTGTSFVVPGQSDQGFTASKGANQIKSGCTSGSSPDYKCIATDQAGSAKGFSLASSLGIPDPASKTIAIRITPRYKNTHYMLSAYDSTGNQVFIKSTKAQIDATAKVGTLYRRVKAEKVIIPTAVEGVFDSVLYSGKGPGDTAGNGICKNLVVDGSGNLIKGNNCP